jgi:hypothetical protein
MTLDLTGYVFVFNTTADMRPFEAEIRRSIALTGNVPADFDDLLTAEEVEHHRFVISFV